MRTKAAESKSALEEHAAQKVRRSYTKADQEIPRKPGHIHPGGLDCARRLTATLTATRAGEGPGPGQHQPHSARSIVLAASACILGRTCE
jgi:hypothetical protein